MRRAWILILLLALVPWAAGAAPAVRPFGSRPDPEAYTTAAAVAGIPQAAAAVPRVTFRLDRYRATLGVVLPPGTPAAAGEAWLQELSDRLGWVDPRLYSFAAPDGLYLVMRAREARLASPFRRRAALPVELLRERLRRWTTQPAWLSLRVDDATHVVAAGQPAAQVTHEGAAFRFYRLDASAPSTLRVEYGLSDRQSAVLVLTLLLWLFFPLAPLAAARSQLQRQKHLDAQERQRIHERWQQNIRIGCAAGVFLTGALLSQSPLRFVAPGFLAGLPLTIPAWYWYGTLARLLPLPSDPDAPPKLDWSGAAGSLLMLVLLCVFFFSTPLITALPRTQALTTIAWGVGGLLALLGIAMLVPMAILVVRTHRHRGAAEPKPEPPSGPAAIRERLAEYARRAEAERGAPVPELPAGTPEAAVRSTLAMHEAMQSLDNEQIAAVSLSSELGMRGTRFHPGQAVVGVILLLALMIVCGIGMALTLGASLLRGGGIFLLILLLGSVALSWESKRSTACMHRTQEEADIAVAQAMDDPQRLLHALRVLEAALAKGETPSSGPTTASLLRRRSNGLARYLGLQ